MSPTLVSDANASIVQLICPMAIAGLLIGFAIAIYRALRDGLAQLKHLHQIPCDRCVYFTGCYQLKCTVHPSKAMTEDAVGCLDFDPAVSARTTCSPCCKKRLSPDDVEQRFQGDDPSTTLNCHQSSAHSLMTVSVSEAALKELACAKRIRS